ncbi:MAG: hypothetical protein HEQ27_20060, partial [Dolichospermum sp. JUN01]|nr:hypothetical protein [Dolichospermum sp. JUN01]
DGTFDVKSAFTPAPGYGVNANNFNYETGDFNGDGKTDLIHFVNNGNGYVHVWNSKGDGTFDVKSAFTPAPGYGVNANNFNYQTGDFNGDGKTDLTHLVNSGNGYVHVWTSNGDSEATVKKEANDALQVTRNKYFPELNQATTLANLQTQINKEIDQSQQQIAQVKANITQKQAESAAALSQATWYEQEAATHWQLSRKSGPTWTEERQEIGRSGKSKTITVTHVDHNWIIWDTYTQQAASFRERAANLFKGIETNTTQQNTASDILKQWQDASNIADQTAITQDQLTTLLNQLDAKRQLNGDKQQQIADWQKLLPTLQTQLQQAIKDAETAKNNVIQEWTEYTKSKQDYQTALEDVLTRRTDLEVQGQQLLQEMNAVEDWVTQQSTLLNDEISQADALITQLKTQRDATTQQLSTATGNAQTNLLTLQNLLNQSIELLTQKQVVLIAQQSTFIQKQTLLNTQKQVIETQYQLLDAYLENPDKDTTSLEKLLTDTRATLAEVQKLAEQAEASSNALTALMDDVQASLLLQNDKYLSTIKDKQQKLEDLLAITELKENNTLKATQKQLELNTLNTQVNDILKKATDAGSKEAAKLLEVVRNNDMATSYEIIYKDYQDLASDKGGWCVKGIARPEDRQIAGNAYSKMLEYRELKADAQQQATQFTQLRTDAENQIKVLKEQESLAAKELVDLKLSIGNNQDQINAKQEELAIAQFRVDALSQLRNWTEQTQTQLLSVEQLNLAQAKLEQDIANNRQYLIDDAVKNQLNKQRLEIERDRQIAVAKLEQLNQLKTEEALQTAINQLRSDIGANPITEIIQLADYKGQLAGILADINSLQQKQPISSENFKTLLTNTSQDILQALQGKEAKTIQDNLLKTANSLIEQAAQLNASITRLDKEEQQYLTLLQQSETDLKGATKQLYDEIQKTGILEQEKDILSAKNLEVLYKVAYSNQAGTLSQELAQQSKDILTQIIDVRIEERKARKKEFINQLIGGVTLVLSIASAALTGGASLGLLTYSFALQTTANILTLTSGLIGAAQSVYNGDWTGAIFKTVMALSTYASSSLNAGLKYKEVVFGIDLGAKDVPKIVNSILSNIDTLQPLAQTAFNGVRAYQSGDSIGALLQVVGGLADYSLPRLPFDNNTLPYQIVNSLRDVPTMIYQGVQSLQNDNLIDGIQGIFNGVIKLGENFAQTLSSDQFKDVSKVLNALELGGNISLNLANAIDKGDLTTWVSSIFDSLKETVEYVKDDKEIETDFKNILIKENLVSKQPLDPKDPDYSLVAKYGQDNVWRDGNSQLYIRTSLKTPDGKTVEIIALGEVDPTKPTLGISHGWLNNKEALWQLQTAKSAKDGEFANANIVIVNWGQAAKNINYPLAADSVYATGKLVANQLQAWGIKGEDLTLIGHSLGAQVSGIIGETYKLEKNQTVKKIWGLDPARPEFEINGLVGGNNPSSDNRLSKNDAQTVTIIHTTYNWLYPLGYKNDAGTEDYYLSNAQQTYYQGGNHSDGQQLLVDFFNSKSKDFTTFFSQQQKDLLDEQISSQTPKISVLIKELDANTKEYEYKTLEVNYPNLNVSIPDLNLPSDNNSSITYRITSSQDPAPTPKAGVTNIIESAITYTLPTGIDNLFLIGNSAINGTGNNTKNILKGNSVNNILNGVDGDDILSGGDGNDTVNGGAGSDRLYGDTGNDILNGDVGNDLLYDEIGNDTLNGGSGDDFLSDGAGNDLLDGGEGNDILSSNAGANLLKGGAGNDTYYISPQTSGGTVIEDSQGIDSLILNQITLSLSNLKREGTSLIIDLNQDNQFQSTNDLTLRNFFGSSVPGIGFIETVNNLLGSNILSEFNNLILDGTSKNDLLTGKQGDDTLSGKEGDDTLNGGAGNDTMIGGLGNDTYIVDSAGDIVTETSTVATEVDTVQSSVSYVLGANLENLILTGSAVINGTGNSLNNAITGNAANNILNGGAGKDIMIGGLGRDTFVYQNLTDSVLSNFDVITDFNATTGNDLFRVATTPTGFVNVGAVNTLDPAGIGAKLTGAVFGSNFAAQFSFGQRTFVAINNAIAGFNPDADSIIEVTGLTGILTTANFTI